MLLKNYDLKGKLKYNNDFVAVILIIVSNDFYHLLYGGQISALGDFLYGERKKNNRLRVRDETRFPYKTD